MPHRAEAVGAVAPRLAFAGWLAKKPTAAAIAGGGSCLRAVRRDHLLCRWHTGRRKAANRCDPRCCFQSRPSRAFAHLLAKVAPGRMRSHTLSLRMAWRVERRPRPSQSLRPDPMAVKPRRWARVGSARPMMKEPTLWRAWIRRGYSSSASATASGVSVSACRAFSATCFHTASSDSFATVQP